MGRPRQLPPPPAFTKGVRGSIPLLLGFSGGTGSGKTYTALRVARGIAGDHPFAVIDTENGRALHYADEFEFEHGPLGPPFHPDAYLAAMQAARKHLERVPRDRRVIVVDSASHEWAGDGGVLDFQAEEFARLGGREAVKVLSWVEPKLAHKRFVTRLLGVDAHVILCFRAEEKIELVKNSDGKTEVVKKESLTGLDGWIPIAEKNLPFELTASWLLTADKPGIGRPIKVGNRIRLAAWTNPDALIDEQVGAGLLAWSHDPAAGQPREAAPAAAREAVERTETAADAEPLPDGGDGKTAPAAAEKAEPVTTAQARTLNRLVDELVADEKIERWHVFRVVAKARGVDPRTLPGVSGPEEAEPVLEWGALLESLTKAEAGSLIERLVALGSANQPTEGT